MAFSFCNPVPRQPRKKEISWQGSSGQWWLVHTHLSSPKREPQRGPWALRPRAPLCPQAPQSPGTIGSSTIRPGHVSPRSMLDWEQARSVQRGAREAPVSYLVTQDTPHPSVSPQLLQGEIISPVMPAECIFPTDHESRDAGPGTVGTRHGSPRSHSESWRSPTPHSRDEAHFPPPQGEARGSPAAASPCP